ncbi:hypothetical protein SK128_004947 [Halocaridina rubra]|uniref:Uncharacterized protein n=1 Tax=Halocaridina rubra TaxID=373956 RepID=A0AAN9ADP1_HALRR
MAGPRSSPTNHSSASNRLAKSELPSQQAPMPLRPGKRRHVATVSPITARSENRSPRAKQRPYMPSRQSPPTVTAAAPTNTPVAVATASMTSSDGQSSTEVVRSGSVSPTQLAVPRVSAEPPCPSELPMPPMHWMAVDAKCSSQRQQCRAVTESLLSHLTTSGILVAA